MKDRLMWFGAVSLECQHSLSINLPDICTRHTVSHKGEPSIIGPLLFILYVNNLLKSLIVEVGENPGGGGGDTS